MRVSSAAKKLLEQALLLPREERATLVEALNQSLEETGAQLHPEWHCEIMRRIEAVERGDSSLIPCDELEDQIHKILSAD